MRVLPGPVLPHPGDRTGFGYLRFVARRQWITMACGASFDIVWLTGLAVTPWAIGRAIDEGIIGGDPGALGKWIAFLIVVALIRAWAEGMRDRAGISNWNQAAFRSVQMLGHRLTRTGSAVGRSQSVGEVLTVQGDAFTLARVYFLVGGLTSSLLSYSVVAVVVLRTSVPLGIFILVGVPAFAGITALVARPLHRRQKVQREASGEMTGVAADAVTGLRVLRGIGGEDQFLARYRERSARTKDAGMALANPIATLEGLQVLLGGLLIVVLTWVGGVLVVRGELRPGELVTFYGYAGFLVIPVNLVADNLSAIVPALVGSRKVLRTMNIEPAVSEHPESTAGPAPGSSVTDRATGIEIAPGTLVALTSPDLTAARDLLERLARVADSAYADHQVTWGGTDVVRVRLDELRRRVLLIGVHPHLYRGTLREALDPHGRHDDAAVQDALYAVGATDIVESAADGLDTEVLADGRNFSGGQRQRLGLARALLARPEILLLDDPTSSVDVHTQHRIVAGLVDSLTPERSIVVVTTNPLLLGRAGVVHHLDETTAAKQTVTT